MKQRSVYIRDHSRESVWENLARMCVLNRRADVAKICLGKMGLFRGARALRAVDHDKPDAKLAILAIHLNMKVERMNEAHGHRSESSLTSSLIFSGGSRESSPPIETVRSSQSTLPIDQRMGKSHRHVHASRSYTSSQYVLQLCQISRRQQSNGQGHRIVNASDLVRSSLSLFAV